MSVMMQFVRRPVINMATNTLRVSKTEIANVEVSSAFDFVIMTKRSRDLP